MKVNRYVKALDYFVWAILSKTILTKYLLTSLKMTVHCTNQYNMLRGTEIV